MPLASMSKVTSTCGTPRGAGGMPTRSNWPSILLSCAIGRSPWKTRMVTADWLSSAVEKVCAALGRDGGVALDQRGEHAAQGLDAQGQRGHVEQQHVLDVALQHAGLDRGAQRHDFVGVHALVGLAAEEGLHGLDAPWACGSCRRPGPLRRCRTSCRPAVLQRLLAGADGLGDQVLDQASSLARDSLMFRCSGPEAFIEMKGRFTSYWEPSRTAPSWPFRPLPSGAAGPACPCAGRRRVSFLNSSAR